MSPRALRLGLLVVILAVGLSVALTYRRAPATADAQPATPRPAAQAARTEDLVFRSFRGEREAFALQAREMLSPDGEARRLRGVTLKFAYTVKGDVRSGTIVADECLYEQAEQRASFRGRVRLISAEGFELATDSLVYRGENGLARSDAPVEFRRKDVSGSARGMRYDAEHGRLELLAEVVVRLRDPDDPPLDLTAGRAVLDRTEGTLAFEGDVRVAQGGDTLRARTLFVQLAADEGIERLQALDDVVVHTAGGPAAAARDLTCRKLNLMFRPDRTLEEAVAGQAEVELAPVASQPGERRRLGGRVLVFGFDEQGRLGSLRGQGGTTFTVRPASGPERLLTSQRTDATLDAATGQILGAEFAANVEYREGKRTATAGHASYAAEGVLSLTGNPQLADEQEGLRLRAQAIDLATRTGDLAARHDVQHVTRPQGGPGLLREPVIVTSRSFEYTAAGGEARYLTNVLLRSGRTEIRAGDVRVREERGARRFLAGGGVRSRLVPPPGEGQGTEPVEGTAHEMSYDEGKREAVYQGEAVVRQGEVVVRSPRAALAFSADVHALERLEAGSPVQIEHGKRRATGESGTYTPQDRTLVVAGGEVVLHDEGQVVYGRKVTFHADDERVLVEGGDAARTETVFRRRP